MPKSPHIFFRLFSIPLRVNIVLLLKEEGELNVGEMGKRLRVEQSKLSHSLRRLEHCNIIVSRKQGNFRYYSLNSKAILPILQLIERHVEECCRGCSRGCK